MRYAIRMFSLAVAAAMAFSALRTADAATVTFGSGANQFTMEFVTIGNPGNAADTTGNPSPAGAVGYVYDIGKYEISEQMVEKVNAASTAAGQNLALVKTNRGPDKPATSITWNEAARFVNWLNESQGYPHAYKYAFQPGEEGYSVSTSNLLWLPTDAGYDPANRFRNTGARYFLPSLDEWYKAAYYDPNHGGPGVGGYWDYPTGSDTAPTVVAGGVAPGTAVYSNQAAADVFDAGGLSPYGTMSQGGNAREWMETEVDLNNDGVGNRMQRGADWGTPTLQNSLLSTAFQGFGANVNTTTVGFRVAAVHIPEPGSIALLFVGLAVLGARVRVRR